MLLEIFLIIENESFVKDLIDVSPLDRSNDETLLVLESKSSLLKWRISDSYYNSGGNKMCFNEEYIDLYNHFTKMLKLAFKVKYSRNLIQILFLKNYSKQFIIHEIKMVLSEKGSARYKDLLNNVDLI